MARGMEMFQYANKEKYVIAKMFQRHFGPRLSRVWSKLATTLVS
jgi:hypothetical protein